MNGLRGRKALIVIFVVFAAMTTGVPGLASGTATIRQPDGTQRTYANVRIAIWNATLALTSSDGQGRFVIGKASCTKVNELVKCLPWDATLFQNGNTLHIAIKSGTVWLNPTTVPQPLSHSSTQLPPHGVLLELHTRRGTFVTLSGVVDEVNR
jgi:hypothetical protein